MAAFVGTWQRVKTENMDAYLEAFNVPEEYRQAAKDQQETFTIVVEGDVWRTAYTAGDKVQKAEFKVGEPVQYKSVVGSTMTGTLKSVGDKMVEEHVMDDCAMDVTREIVDGQMVVSTTAKGITFKAWFDRK